MIEPTNCITKVIAERLETDDLYRLIFCDNKGHVIGKSAQLYRKAEAEKLTKALTRHPTRTL